MKVSAISWESGKFLSLLAKSNLAFLCHPRNSSSSIKPILWHAIQTILVDDGNMLTISLQIKINYELISDIFSHGDEVRVDGPKRLREKVRNISNSKLI
jgi:hypothetical protein